MGKPEGKKTLARSNRRGEDHIKIDPQKIERCEGWILLAQGGKRWWTRVNTVMKHRFPQTFMVFLDWLRSRYFSEDPALWSYC
jgi:hypothetical protein